MSAAAQSQDSVTVSNDDSGRVGGLQLSAGSVLSEGESRDARRAALRAAILSFGERGKKEHEHLHANRPASYMDVVILWMILANTLLMAMEHFDGTPVPVQGTFPVEYDCCDPECIERDTEGCTRGLVVMGRQWREALFWGDGAFNVIFTIETTIRLLGAWSIRSYLIENFPTNLVDLLIVLTSDIVFGMSIFYPNLLKVAMLRLIRVMRAFRVVSRFRRLKVLLSKAAASFKTILQVLFVLIFWHVVMALLGMQIFACSVRREDLCTLGDDGECREGCSVLNDGVCYFTNDEVCVRSSYAHVCVCVCVCVTSCARAHECAHACACVVGARVVGRACVNGFVPTVYTYSLYRAHVLCVPAYKPGHF